MSDPSGTDARDDLVAFVSSDPAEGLVLDVYEAKRDGYYVQAATSRVDRLNSVAAFIRSA